MKREFKSILSQIVLCMIICIMMLAFVSISLHLNIFASVSAYIYRLYILLFVFALILFIFSFIIYIKNKRIFNFDFSDITTCIVMSALFVALFFSLGPMVVERSYTVYSLAYMTDNDGLYSYEDVRNQFVTGYVDKGATQKRLNEQVDIGNIEKDGETYRITEKGKRLINLFRFIEKIFPVPDKSSIYPEKLE